jgi:hypothetical protein
VKGREKTSKVVTYNRLQRLSIRFLTLGTPEMDAQLVVLTSMKRTFTPVAVWEMRERGKRRETVICFDLILSGLEVIICGGLGEVRRVWMGDRSYVLEACVHGSTQFGCGMRDG